MPNKDGPLLVHYLRQRDVLRGAQVQRMVVLPGQHQQLHSLGQLPMLQEEFGCMGSMLTAQLDTRWALLAAIGPKDAFSQNNTVP